MNRVSGWRGYRQAVLLYGLLFALLTWPFWVSGQVIAPHRAQRELGLPATSGPLPENRDFNDCFCVFLPEVEQHLNGPRSGWLALWSSRNELGRPLYHVSGFSPAYAPSWVLSRLCREPHRFLTILSLGQVFLGGLFMIGLAREMGWSPVTGLVAGGLTASSPFVLFWLSFPMFVGTWVWSVGALWAVRRLAAGWNFPGWALLAFSSYSLAMTGYPQLVVYHAYLLAGCSGVLLTRRWRASGARGAGALAGRLASAVVIAALLVLPAYRDLAVAWRDSLRVHPEPSFFTVVLPRVHQWSDAVRWQVRAALPQLAGRPILPGHPLNCDGLIATPLLLLLAALGVLASFRQACGWVGATLVFLAVAFIPGVLEFGVRYLGLSLSRTNPVAALFLPLAVLAALGVESVVRKRVLRFQMAAVLAAGVAVLAVDLIWAAGQPWPVQGAAVGAVLAVGAAAAWAWIRPAPGWWVLALGLNAAWFGFPLMLRQDPAAVARTSPLVERLHRELAPDERYAVVPPATSVLPPNANALVGLNSVHTYDSLSSRRYQAAVAALGGAMRTLGRWNTSIAPDPAGAVCWMSNIAVLIAREPPAGPGLEPAENVGPVWLARVKSRMGPALQVRWEDPGAGVADLTIGDQRVRPHSRPLVRRDEGDLVELAVKDPAPSVVVLSRQYHRDWRAEVQAGRGWLPVPTTAINGIFLGARLPAGTNLVRFRFEPWVRWAWVGHIFWLGIGAGLLLHGWLRGRDKSTAHPV